RDSARHELGILTRNARRCEVAARICSIRVCLRNAARKLSLTWPMPTDNLIRSLATSEYHPHVADSLLVCRALCGYLCKLEAAPLEVSRTICFAVRRLRAELRSCQDSRARGCHQLR